MFIVHLRELKLLMRHLPSNEGSMFTISYIVHTFNSFAMEFTALVIGETIINKFQSFRPLDVGMKEFNESKRGEFVHTFNHSFPGLANVSPNRGF